MQNWGLEKLMGLQFTIEYKKGRENTIADVLSRKCTEGSVAAIYQIGSDLLQTVKDTYNKDNKIQKIIDKIQLLQQSYKQYEWQREVLKRKGRIVVGQQQEVRNKLLAYFHESVLGGHSEASHTYKRLNQIFYWKRMQKEVKDWVHKCTVCQRNKPVLTKSASLLQPLLVPTQAWQCLAMDFIVGLPKSNGKTIILVVVDRYTKYAHFVALRHPINATKIAQVFIDTIVKLHGWPSEIVSDRDSIFMSKFWSKLFKLHGVKFLKSTAFHPQTDGQSEALNKVLEGYLRCATGEMPSKWSEFLSYAESWYNTKFHSATKMTPFEALYGYKPINNNPLMAGDTTIEAVDYTIRTREEIATILHKNLKKAQGRMQLYANKNRTNKEFVVGDWVYLKLQPFKQQSIPNSAFHKLAARFYGPYRTVERVGEGGTQARITSSSSHT